MSDDAKPEEQQTVGAAEAPVPEVSDGEEEETHVPAHDVTATTVSGSRVRRSTQKFTVDEPKADGTDEFQPPVGKGQKIKDIALVNDIVAALGKKQAEILKALYLAMYGRRFQLKNLKVIKEHIIEFSGIPEQDDKAREVLFSKLARWKRGFVQEVMDVLGVDRSKKSFDEEEKTFDKDSLVNRLIDWLYNPQEKKGGRKPSTPKSAAKKPKKAEKAKTPAAKRKRTTKETTAAAKKKQKTTKKGKAAAAAEESEDEDDNEDEDEDENSGDESASDFDESKKKKKAPTAAAKKKTPAAAAAKKKKAPATKRAPRKLKSSKPIESDDDESGSNNNDKDDDDKEEEEPETKTKTKSAKNTKGKTKNDDESKSALDADVQAKVKQIIEQGNAEELTVKKIVRQVSEELGRDLSGEKNAIKEFIKAGQ